VDIEQQVAQANGRLKQAKIGIVIWKRGDKLSLRGMLPPKPGSPKTTSSQQTIALDIYANPAGIKRAEAEARKVGGQLACKEFSWDIYLKNPAEPTAKGLNGLKNSRKITLLDACLLQKVKQLGGQSIGLSSIPYLKMSLYRVIYFYSQL